MLLIVVMALVDKFLHIGHLRNLILASSICNIAREAEPVAMLGASQGVIPEAEIELMKWYELAGYNPKLYRDINLSAQIETELGTGEYEGCRVWNGPLGPVTLIRSDGRPTYAYHELAFEKQVAPTHYLTADEQKSHFAALGLASKHLPMGLVLGEDGKKLSSRTGEVVLAKEAMSALIERLEKKDDLLIDKLAWNIFAWNMTSVGRTQNIKFLPNQWCKADQPGLYISLLYSLKGLLRKRSLMNLKLLTTQSNLK